MSPYEILRIPETADPEQIRAAYEDLMERYSSDRYLYGALADLAAAKREELRNAYRAITGSDPEPETGADPAPAMEAEPAWGSGESPARFPDPVTDSTPAAGATVPVSDAGSQITPSAAEVRRLLRLNQLDAAEQMLNSLPPETEEAERCYLRGSVAWRRGWLDEARQNLARAVELEPERREYKELHAQLMKPVDSGSRKKSSGKKHSCMEWGDGAECCCGCMECICDGACESLCEGACDC